jgi:hypothetical protein
VNNARLRASTAGHVLEKAAPGRFIDGCVAAILAYEAAHIMEPVNEPEVLIGWS